MELRQLQHFLVLAELGSFRLAGERVHVTQQAVSKSIALFEARIGAKLFEREGRRVRLTPIGELLLPHARAIAAELKHFDDEHDAFKGARSGRLGIGSTPTLLGDVIPDVLKALHRSHPRLVLSVISGNSEALLDRLQRGEIDIVIVAEPVAVVDDDVAVERLCKEFNVVVASPNHPLAGSSPTPRQLQRAPWIRLEKFSRADADIQNYFRTARLKAPIPRVRTENNAFAMGWVERTEYLCALPSRAVAGAVREGRVTTLNVTLTDTPWSLVAAYRRRAIRTPAMSVFLDSLRKSLRDDAIAPAGPRGA